MLLPGEPRGPHAAKLAKEYPQMDQDRELSCLARRLNPGVLTGRSGRT